VGRIVRLVFLATSLALCGCAGFTPSPGQPGTLVAARNPDPAKWMLARPGAQPRPNKWQNAQIFVCRPLTCSGNSAVGVLSEPSPTRHVDRAVLEKMAKFMPAQAKAQDVMMEAVSDGEERMTPLSSKVTEFRGYPAVLSETKRTSKSKVIYGMRGELFIGVVHVRILSIAPDRAEAKRNFDAFVDALDILDVPLAEEAAGPPATAPAALENAGPPAER
jgi:hypothetical protein